MLVGAAGTIGGEPVRGYRENEGVASGSQTDTYAALPPLVVGRTHAAGATANGSLFLFGGTVEDTGAGARPTPEILRYTP